MKECCLNIIVPSPVENTEHPAPTIAGVLLWTRMIRAPSTTVFKFPDNVSILMPAEIQVIIELRCCRR